MVKTFDWMGGPVNTKSTRLNCILHDPYLVYLAVFSIFGVYGALNMVELGISEKIMQNEVLSASSEHCRAFVNTRDLSDKTKTKTKTKT